MIFLGHQDFMTNELKHWKYLKVIDVMVIPLCPKTPADSILGTHNGACGYAYLHGIACHITVFIIWHIKNVQPCKIRSWIENELIEWINSDQFRLSIPIQFQFKISQFKSNSIHAELNWIDYQFQLNSWIDPSPDEYCYKHISKILKQVNLNVRYISNT